MTPLLRAYLLAMAAPAVVPTAMLLGLPPEAPGDPVLLVVLLVLGAVATNFPVMVSPRLKTDAAPAVYLAAVLVFPPVTAVALIGGGARPPRGGGGALARTRHHITTHPSADDV